MKDLYYIIGYATFWFCSIISLICLFLFLFGKTIDFIAKHYKPIWIIFEFQFYNSEFKKWVKDKPRNKNMIK
jgi:hypothetical protein